LQIVYRIPPGPGWHPVTYMARLAAELFDAQLNVVPQGQVAGKLAKLRASLLQRGRGGKETCLVIAATPRDLLAFMLEPGWGSRFGKVVGWCIDSFWTSEIPKLLNSAKFYDAIFVTTAPDVAEWEKATGAKSGCLPWGSDVLRFGSPGGEREIDLLRIGRQPGEWDDDKGNAAACESRRLRYQGRTPIVDDPVESYRANMQLYGRSKFLLAFSNAANPTHYTHPTRQYLTARWTDALASGVTVAGILPQSPEIQKMLWPEATVELGTIEREPGLAKIAEAVAAWSPAQAVHNYKMALARLDWRWRLAEIAKVLGEPAPKLMAEIEQIKARLNDMQAL